MHHNAHCSPAYKNLDLEAMKVSVKGRMDKKHVVHIYNGILLNYEMNEIRSFAATRMDLDTHTK